MGNVPSISDFQKYSVNSGNQEIVQQSLYDFQTYPAAGVAQMLFFQVPAGQGGKTLADTNMEGAGQLPNPKALMVTSIEVMYFPTLALNGGGADLDGTEFAQDVFAVMMGAAYLEFFIGSKTYLRDAPLCNFPPATKLFVAGSASDSTTAAADRAYRLEYATVTGRPYILNVPIPLPPTQNFNVSLNFPTVIATPSTATGRIGVRLNGYLLRNSQ
jgi:hypothetical protein